MFDTNMLAQTGGRGGFEDSLDRPAELVLQDVIDGYVSPERAWQDYGVVIHPDRLEVDEPSTIL